MSALAGAFASKKGLGETKEQKKEAAEIQEIKRLAAPPTWVRKELLIELRSTALDSVTLSASPIDVREAIVVGSKAIARVSQRNSGNGQDPTGDWWAILLKPDKAEMAEEAVVCLGQDSEGKVRGAIGWWPSRVRTASGDALCAANAIRALSIDDEGFPAVVMPHPTVDGVGENNKQPAPATSDILAPVPLQLSETMRQYHVGRSQVNARLQRGGASDDEKQHIRLLLNEACQRIGTYSCESELPKDDLLQCESAVQGLRKAYLAREWESRCSFCGVRHSIVEKGSCKFWIAWAETAKENSAPKLNAPASEPDVEPPVKPHVEPPPAPSAAPADGEDGEDGEDGNAVDEAAAADTFAPFMPYLKKIA